MADESLLLEIPEIRKLPREERERIHSVDPDFSNRLREAISSDMKFGGLSPQDQEKVYVELGFPSQAALSQPQVPPITKAAPELAPLRPMDPTNIMARPTLARGEAPIGVTSGATVVKPWKPSTTLLGQLTEGYRQNIDRTYSSPPQSGLLSSPTVRGALAASPVVAPFLPTGYNPDILSAEGAARVAAETIVTAPLFGIAGKGISAAKPMFEFFTKYPGAARFIAEGYFIGGVDVAYRRFLKWTGDAIQNGEIEWGPNVPDFLWDTFKTGSLILGFGGVLHGARAAGSAVGRSLERAGAGVPSAVPSSATESQIVSSVAKNWGETLSQLPQPQSGHPVNAWPWPSIRGVSEMEKRIPPGPRDIFSPTAPGEQAVFPGMQGPSGAVQVGLEAQALAGADPRQLGLNFEPSITRSAPPRRPQTVIGPGAQIRPQFDPATNTFGIPGQRPERPRTVIGYPQSEAAVKSVLGPHKTEITPEGNMQTSIAEPALKAQFVAQEHANSGDWIYLESAGGKSPQVGQVVNRFENGVQVKTDRSQFFVPFERVTGKVANAPFAQGEEVLRASGEKVIVKGYTPDNRVWIRRPDGSLEVDSLENLTTYAKDIAAKEVAERAALGIEGPSPEGNSIMDIFRSEAGAFYPGQIIGRIPGFRKWRQKDVDDEIAGKLIRTTATTQPMDENFGIYAYFVDPVVVYAKQRMGPTGPGHYLPLIDALYKGKSKEVTKNFEIDKTIRGLQKMVGRSEESAQRLNRAAMGVLRPGETLNNAEQGVMSAWKAIEQNELIPRLNARRALLGQPPVPPNYPYALHLFPELILAAGQSRSSMGAKAMANAGSIKILGVDNEIEYGGSAARLELSGNFWKLAERVSKYISHEEAWREPIEMLKKYSALEVSSGKKKFIDWHARDLEGAEVSPAIADISSFSHKIDKQIAKLFTKNTADIVMANGTRVRLEVPMFTLAGTNPSNVISTIKKLSYANTIGLNIRSAFVNNTQLYTHLWGNLPGNPLSTLMDVTAGHIQGIGTLMNHLSGIGKLFGKDAVEHYRNIGVLHDMEDIFSQASYTATTGPMLKNVVYAGEYLYNAASAITFANMRWSEIVNRVAGFHATQSAYTREAKRQGMEGLLADPNFQRAIRDVGVHQTNISNFLYGKGFKSPVQESLGFSLDAGQKTGLKALAAPFGEALYQYNTFATKAFGLAMMHWGQLRGEYGNLAGRLARMNGPAEFGQLLDSMKGSLKNPLSDRHALLRTLVFQTATAWAVGNITGLNSIFYQLLPNAQFGLSLKNPVMSLFGKLVEQVSGFNALGAGESIVSSLIPGRSAYERASRGGFDLSKESLLATRPDVEGRKPRYVQPNPIEQIESILFGSPARERTPRY